MKVVPTSWQLKSEHGTINGFGDTIQVIMNNVPVGVPCIEIHPLSKLPYFIKLLLIKEGKDISISAFPQY